MRAKIAKGLMIAVLLTAAENVSAQLLEETGGRQSMDQYTDQAQGNYQPMNMGYAGFSSNSIGMIQDAWQDPLQNLGEGQTKPAYSKYYWSPDLVLPIRLREGMLTLVNFPEWELLEDVFIGDNGSFTAQISSPNTLLLFPAPGVAVGADTNIMVFGRSGNKYVFYVRSEAVNTERLTNSIVDIDVSNTAGASGGSPSSGSGVLGSGSSGHVNASAFRGNSGKSVDSTFTKRFQKEDWLKSIPLDPTKFRFDIETYVPNPDDVIIAPERVWRDDIFTYIDLGEKALNMTQRPVVSLIIERVETPVGFRTKGPNNRLIIVEGIGDMVMRSGKRMVCLKLRRSNEEGLEYTSYANTDDDWDVSPAIPNGAAAAAGAAGSAAAGAAGSAAGGNGSGTGISGQAGAAAGVNGWENRTSGGNGKINSGYQSGAAGAGISCGNIDCSEMTHVEQGKIANVENPYPQYKYGSAFVGQKGDNLSIELGTDANVNNLENLWEDLSGKYSSLLGGYEPFYSVDTPADGQGKELFHLRVGPLKSLENGDAVCSQLGRNGIFCSVVRVQ